VKRIAVKIAYRGTNFHGWQRQPNEISVQEVVETNLCKLLGQKEYPIVGCGRTDTGVHASEYFFHTDIPSPTDLQDLAYKLNRVVGSEIVIKEIKEVASDWHARFDAKRRTYRYFVHREKNPFITDESVYIHGKFDLDRMNKACQHLIGKKDFTSLSKLHTDVKTNICTVTEAKWVQMNETRFYFEISADRFLRNMVRATVGTLLEIGQGKMDPSEMKTILEKMDRGAASQSAPGQGLFLCGVDY
jgi:tRNA pseudouridine38-40 synthase